MHSDSSAARAFAQKERLGKQTHVHARLRWIQERVEQGRIGILRLGAQDNKADMLTKALAANVVKRNLASLGFECRTAWSQLQCALEVSAASRSALVREGLAVPTAASAQDRGVLSHSAVKMCEVGLLAIPGYPSREASGASFVTFPTDYRLELLRSIPHHKGDLM
eukprot:3238559-Amphidinium_carterae.1